MLVERDILNTPVGDFTADGFWHPFAIQDRQFYKQVTGDLLSVGWGNQAGEQLEAKHHAARLQFILAKAVFSEPLVAAA